MNRAIGALSLLAMAGAALASPALAQQATEDWDLTTNAEQQLTLATLDFGSNVLALRCRAGALDLLLTGVPVSTGATRKVQVSAGVIAAEDQTWVALPDQPILGADEPGRLARQLRAGGDLDIRLDPEDDAGRPRRYRLTAPASAMAVNTVLTACGQPLNEPRDLLTRVYASPETVWVKLGRTEFPNSPAAAAAAPAVVRGTCIIGDDWGLKDCRVESETAPGLGFGASAVEGATESQLGPPADGTDLRGRVFRFTVRFAPPAD